MKVQPDEPNHGSTDIEVMSVPDVAHALRLGQTAAWHLVHSGQLPSMKIGRRRLIRRVDVAQFLAERVAAEAQS